MARFASRSISAKPGRQIIGLPDRRSSAKRKLVLTEELDSRGACAAQRKSERERSGRLHADEPRSRGLTRRSLDPWHMAGISANRLELLQIADAVAREKSIDRKIVIEAMEDAIQKAAKSRYGAENDIRCEIDPKTGETRLTRVLAVVESVENDSTADHARRCARGATPRPRSATSSPSRCRPWISAASPRRTPSRSSCRRCARPSASASYSEYKDRIGEIVNGTVKRVEYGNVIVDLGRAEGIIRRDEMIPRENVRYGDRIRAYIYDVRREQRGPQIFLSRARPGVHVEAVRAGGAGDLRRHRRDQVGGPRPGLPRQDRGHLQGFLHRSRGRLRRHARLRACRRSSTSCRARRSTSSSGTRTRRASSSTRWRLPR